MSERRPVVRRFEPSLKRDFLELHCEQQGLGWCRCVAWWVPTWDGWGARSAEENLALRESLWERGECDGYLAYEGAKPIGWCQVGERDRLEKLRDQYGLPPRPGTWAITCFAIARDHRRQGLARFVLDAVLADLRERGVRRIEAFPKRAAGTYSSELWTGPEQMYLAAGFRVERDDPLRPILVLEYEEGR